MIGIEGAVIVGGGLAGLIVTVVLVGMRRARIRRKTDAAKPVAGETRTFEDRTTEERSGDGGRAYRPGRVQDRRSLWARRYGAGGAWAGAAWTAGAGLHLTQNRDGVGDPIARCSGSPGAIGGACGGGVGGCTGGCGAGGGCAGGCGGGCGGGS